MPNHWLLKTEPGTYSFDQLIKDRKTHWSGIRNYQARNFLREMAVGDLALIYHSGDDKSVMGIAKVVKAPYPDLEDDGDWSQVDISVLEKFQQPVPLGTIKATEALKDMLLVRHSRISVMPITTQHYRTLLKMGVKSK